MVFALADLRRSFDATTLARGRTYFERGHVGDVEQTAGRFRAKVAGSNATPYAVSLDVVERNGVRSLVGSCSCQVRTNCKHAAATAFAALSRFTVTSKRDAADGAVDSWIESIASRDDSNAPKPLKEHLRYTIDVQERYYVPRFNAAAYVVTLLKKGEAGTSKAYDVQSIATGSAKHITPVDRTIGRLINASGLVGGLGNASPTIIGTLLDLLIRTERLHWSTLDAPVLQLHPLASARLAWSRDADDRQRIHLEGRPSTVLISSTPLWYVDPEHAVAGPVDVGIDGDLASMLAAAPAFTDEQSRRVQLSLRKLFADIRIEGPTAPVDPNTIDREPTPVLTLSSSSAGVARYATAELRFDYGGRMIAPADYARALEVRSNGTTMTWSRHTTFEKSALKRLEELGVGAGQSRVASSDERAWIRFLGSTVPQLRADGWRVEIDDRFPHTIVEADEEWHGDLSEREQRWFELGLGIDVNGERISLLPVLLEALAENGIRTSDDLSDLAARSEPIFGKLPNGTYIALPASRVARVLATLIDLLDAPDALDEAGRLRITAVQAAAIAGLDRAVDLQWTNAAPLKELLESLRDVNSAGISIPSSFLTELRPYQREGVAWLQRLREHGFGGVLADDMGLGKTVQLLAHVAIEKEAGRLHAPVLIVAPTSVVPNWRSEIVRFTPHLRVVSLTGADRAERFTDIPSADIVLTTYALLPRDSDYIAEHEWSIAVLDEAQAIKNPRVKAAIVATGLRAGQRIAMTGTPIENHLDELWSIYAFAVPGLLGARPSFSRLFRTPIEKQNDTLRRTTLATRLRPFFLRRTKELVAPELPPKTEIVQRVELAGAQRDLYETIRLAMHKRVRDEVARRGLARSRIVVLDALLKLRQVCCDPRLLKLPAASGVQESSKLEALLEMLESLVEDKRRVLVFSQFTSMLDLVKPELLQRQIPFVELRGTTKDRETPIRRFQRGEVPLFLISLKAGGTGVNLTAADTVIHYDPWWNPAVERQATDRAHRIGQEQHVFVYKLIAEGTVEERILELQDRKGALASTLFDETSTAPLQLEAADIERLFA